MKHLSQIFLSKTAIVRSCSILLCILSFGCAEVDDVALNSGVDAKIVHPGELPGTASIDSHERITALFTPLDSQRYLSAAERTAAMTVCGSQPGAAIELASRSQRPAPPTDPPLFREAEAFEGEQQQTYFEENKMVIDLPRSRAEAVAERAQNTPPSALELAIERMPRDARAQVAQRCRASDLSECARFVAEVHGEENGSGEAGSAR